MGLRILTGLLVGKSISFLSQKLHLGGGSAAPGLYALKIAPDLVTQLSQQIPQTVVITGTNGKTTTAKLLAHFAQTQGLKVIRNQTGSNLERGIASTLISSSHFRCGNTKFDLAIWELDEAAFNQTIHKIKPDIIVFLNVFRDQLDRYGEIDSVIKKWCQSLSSLDKNTKIFINGDDHNLLQLKKAFTGNIKTFGLTESKIRGEKVINQSKANQLDFLASDILTPDLETTKFQIEIDGQKTVVRLPLAGIYNIYNFISSFLVAQALGLSAQTVLNSLNRFSPAFGRMEKFELTPRRWKAKTEGYIFLIKNPTGATQVFQTIAPHLKSQDRILIALNDNLADGTDVSWIWDSNFEVLQNSSRAQLHIRQAQCNLVEPEPQSRRPKRQSNESRDFHVICSGTRAEELALRLKYAGYDQRSIKVENNLKKAFVKAQDGLTGRLFILPTYTALLELQKIMTEKGIKKHYWKEE